MSRDNKDLVVGLDIGTSRIIALVADLDQEGRLNVIGVGSQESRGLKKGVATLCIGGGEGTAVAIELI